MFQFTNLRVWTDSISYCKVIYQITQGFPNHELYGLTSQIRRSVSSIASNIAEGNGRYSLKEQKQFYSIALGSLNEVITQLFISKEVNYIDQIKLEELLLKGNNIQAQLRGLIRSVNNRIKAS